MIDFTVNKILYVAHLMERALHEPEGWSIQWGPYAVPATRVITDTGVRFDAIFPERIVMPIPVAGTDETAWVSREDWQKVERYSWSWSQKTTENKYLHANTGSGPVTLHRFIFGEGVPKGMHIDHRDGDPLNNSRWNLRLATSQQNAANARLSRANTTGYKGVGFHKAARKYAARIMVSGKSIHLGLFTNPEDAARAYDRAALEHFGEFSFLNFPMPSNATLRFNGDVVAIRAMDHPGDGGFALSWALSAQTAGASV